MFPEITKSRSIPANYRNSVMIHRDLYYLLALEAEKQRIKPKDLITHLLVSGLQNLGVDVSGVVEEPDHKEVV
jgi:hypothetical protein